MHLPAVFVPVLLLAASCGDIDVTSIRVGEAVPAALAGEWTGSWQSTRTGGSGSVTLRMQDFAGEAVVSVQIDNPCVAAAEYRFRTSGNVIELLSDDVVLFSAVLDEQRSLVGSYGCAADGGVWEVAWVRELPPLIDLGGRWEGSVTLPGIPAQPMLLELALVVRGGALVVEGTVQFPTLAATLLPVHGFVQFQATTFDFALAVTTGSSLAVQLLAVGELATRSIGTGLLQTNGDPSVPFTQAGWRAQWVAR